MYVLFRSATNVISAILNVGQDVDEDWPLFVKVGNASAICDNKVGYKAS